MKAFLAHSGTDKHLVESIAKQLGRQFSLYDSYSFETGDEFSAAIKRCLDDTSVFVLFASRHSLERIWVKYEIEEAYHRKLRLKIAQALVYIIDDGVAFEDIPEWLQRSLIRKEKSPKLIARDIRLHINQLFRERRQTYFAGRGKDLERLEELLTPIDGTSPPRSFLVYGLPGIGRRSLVRHSAQNVLGFRKSSEIQLSEGDSIHDLCVKTADLVETFSGVDEFNRVVEEIRSLSTDAALDRCIRNLTTLSSSRELPIIVDDGGLVDNEGFIKRSISTLLRAVPPNDILYISMISHRKPKSDPTVLLPMLPLRPLSLADSRRLLLRLFNDKETSISPSDLNEIAEYVAGYPPSAYFAVEQAKSYSVALVVSHKYRLVEFRTGVFLRHIEKLSLGTTEGEVLQLLATFSPLPLQTVVAALEITLEKATDTLINLIDLSLVTAEGEGLFRISNPISEAANNIYGFPDKVTMKKVGISLRAYIRSAETQHGFLGLSQMLFRAARLSGVTELEADVVRLSSDLIRLTEDYYHSRDYDQSIKCGRVAVSERPDSVSARSYLVRALAQQEMWDAAEIEMQELANHAPPRDVRFLRGFVYHRQGNYANAITEFDEAWRLGRKGVAISRELSQCHFLLGNIKQAQRELRDALRLHGDNRYVVDLWAQISTLQHNETDARKALDRLEVIDKPVFYFFRKSRVEWLFGNMAAARSAIQRAVEITHKPPFHIIAQAALCEIASANLSLARKYLHRLDSDFGGIKLDIRVGLRCRLETAEGNHVEAHRLSERFIDKQSSYYYKIRGDILGAIIEEQSASAELTEQYKLEYDFIRKKVGENVQFDIPGIDSY